MTLGFIFSMRECIGCQNILVVRKGLFEKVLFQLRPENRRSEAQEITGRIGLDTEERA